MRPGIRKASKLPNEIKPLLALAALILVPALLLTACGGGDSSASDSPGGSSTTAKLNVVATTVQITALTREVGGDRIDLSGLIQPGADPHTFEPTASDLTKIEGADAILRHSLGLDDWLDGTLQAGAHAQVTTVTAGITPLKSEENGATVADPHVWHDPDNDKIMVDNIAAALGRADPRNTKAYEDAAAAYKMTLDATKQQVQQIIAEIPRPDRKLVTNHDAFGYFARAFGLTIVGAVIPSVSTEAEPSAQQTAALLDTISREHVKAIFAESSVNPKLATTLANDAGVKIVDDLYGDSLGEPVPCGDVCPPGPDTVHGMLLYNARKIADALK